MYLVKAGDKIAFKVKAEGAEKYEWQVNKAVQEAKADTFAWTVPDGKGVWEIHLEASNKDGAAHQEWVVSTLTKSEAPVLFDYFCPDRSQKDPWGRPLPKWESKKKIDLSYCSLHRTVAVTPCKNAYGTWIWQRRYGPKGKRGSFSWRISRGEDPRYYYYIAKPMNSGAWDFTLPSKYGPIKVHCMGRSSMGECCSSWADDTDDWAEVRIVRTKDGWFWVWIDGQLWFYSLANENTLKEVDSLRFWGRWVDCVQVYDRPVWPKKSIRFDEYRDDCSWKKDHQEKRKGIIIDGHGVRLKDIAEAINDPKIFRYDPATKTATCHTDLVISPGAELVIDGETLKMHCNKDGEHQIRVENCSTVRLNNATVTSGNDFYYLWAFTSACKWEHYKKWSGYPAMSFSGRFLATDATISNCGNLFIDSPGEMILRRCKLVDLVEVDIGNYWKGRTYDSSKKRMAGKGKKGLWFYNRKELVNFRIEDCTISGKEKPLDITFIGGDDLHRVTILNSRLDNISAKKGYRFNDWRRPYFYETTQMSCTVSLLNCKFKKPKARSSKAWVVPKYYLDVLAVDKEGKPASGCRVRVTNEVDDVKYPAENLAEKRDWVGRNLTYNRWIKVWLDVNDLKTAVPTGEDGHTAPPSDKANTLVLTDYIRGQDDQQEFTYTVQVIAPDGRFGEIKGIDPGPDWYRKDPNKPAHTVKVVLDKATEPVPARKTRPPVKTARSPWPCFRGPDHAHTGRSPHVGPSKCRPLWRYKTDGEILNSSPVIGGDGTIYISDNVMLPTLHAVNPDGTRKWRYKATFIRHLWSPGSYAPAIGRDGTLYVAESYDHGATRLRALSPEGKSKWEYEDPKHHWRFWPIQGPDGAIYYGVGQNRSGRNFQMYAIRPDGKLKWACKVKDKGKHYRQLHMSAPAFGPDGTVYIGSAGHGMSAVVAVNAEGKIKWTYTPPEGGGRITSSPAVSVAAETVYVASSKARGCLLALGFDGSLKWRYKVGDQVTCSPAIGSDGTVYFGSRDEYLYAVDKNGKEKWKYKTGDRVLSSPAVDAEGKIFFGSHDHYLYCLSPKGKLIWKCLTGGSVLSSPAIGADGTVYVGSADGYLYAFGN